VRRWLKTSLSVDRDVLMESYPGEDDTTEPVLRQGLFTVEGFVELDEIRRVDFS